MSKVKVLVVGCGAVGLSQGYHLSAGADITYLVRPSRKSAFAPPKRLYSYRDNQVFIFSSYHVIESVSEVSGESFAFILDTLDGHTARSEGGVATIQSVGNLINEPQNADCFVVYDAVSLDMEEHYARNLRIAPSRLFLALSLLAHQPSSDISIPTSASKDLIAKSDLLYIDNPPNVGLMAFNTRPALLKKLQAIYHVNGNITVKSIPAFTAPWAPLIIAVQLVSWNLDGFGPFQRFRANSELWQMMLRAQHEVLNLPRFGWTGWVMSWVLGSWVTEKMNLSLIKGAKPLDYAEFNAFHHGRKVSRQDRAILEDLLSEGEKEGRKMPALRYLVRRAMQL
ncbi:hypothetical protein C7974DRAFT_407189 [Boeremia exigua]|uniref:uncharacterized protein n=1 Tax=Boeremia exigua TaxID=749465 RepID=UPI001E8EAC1D|nr:uncharacterized protein C7974DRAFT_407189 [Boeremia exigua]KAH6611687.1 hypothetical protein C7974DRAFT_407189 [Boeremia exigua]